jgi:probable HAF family extracellular repeat protein
MTLLSGTLGWPCTEALGVNDLGQVVGWAGTDQTLPHGDLVTPEQAVLWQNGVAIGLGVPPDYQRSEAMAINNAGQVVVLANPSGFGGSGRPFLWQNGIWTDLGIPYAKSVNINNSGQILIAATNPLQSFLLNPIDPNAPTLALTGFPVRTTAGVPGSFMVTVRNPDGSVDSGYSGTIRFSSTDSQAALPSAYTFTSADAGVHTFVATLKTAGTRSITVTDYAEGIVGSEAGIVVSHAAASQLRISSPYSSSVGVAFSVTITALDAYGNLATGYVGTVHFSSSDNRATLPANYTFTAADQGVHTFSGIILKKRGWQSISVGDTLLPSLSDTWSISVS